MIGRLAERYLKWRGHIVVPRAFVGIIIGGGVAVKSENTNGDTYRVWLPHGAQLVAVYNTVVRNIEEGEQ